MGPTAQPARWCDGVADLAGRYDAFLVDQWGVLHDGTTAYPGAADALVRLRRLGKPVVLISNSGKRAGPNSERLARLGFGPDCYDACVSSGEAAWREMAAASHPFTAALGRRCLLFSRGGDRSIVDGLDLIVVETADEADFVLLSGHDERRAPADYRPHFDAALARDLPLLCANPDTSGLTADGLVLSPGALADHYEARGGRVRRIGKPFPEIYRLCRQWIGDLPPERVVAIGDSLANDIEGGAAVGHATALILGGLHADVFIGAEDWSSRQARLARLTGPDGVIPDWMLLAFHW